LSQKIELRKHWKGVRKVISPDRRQIASKAFLDFLQTELKGKKILSFASFGAEIDTSLINNWLLGENALFLPRVEETGLQIYLVKDLDADLIPSKFGPKEPDPLRCERVDPASLDVALIPGLAFDAAHQRLGYGKGHYDRFLNNHSLISIGVGFAEQNTLALASDPWDIPLVQVVYF